MKLLEIASVLAMSVAATQAADTNAAAGGAAPAPAGGGQPAAQPAGGSLVVAIETSLGMIKAELWPDKAPITVSNFLAYADAKFYEGLIFHRVIDGFMIQGGGFTPDMQQKRPRPPIKNEARTDVGNERGTLAMARTPIVDSASSQFFINLVNNGPRGLNHRDETDAGFGYCVFGKVTAGMDVVDKIGKVQTAPRGPYDDVPIEPVIIKSIRRVETR